MSYNENVIYKAELVFWTPATKIRKKLIRKIFMGNQLNLWSNFKKELLIKRKELNLTQKRLGELSGIHRSTICRIEKGVNAPRFKTYIALQDALKEAK